MFPEIKIITKNGMSDKTDYTCAKVTEKSQSQTYLRDSKG